MAENTPQMGINIKDQYPTATRIEDGIAYDISGKRLGPVKGIEADQQSEWKEVPSSQAAADSDWVVTPAAAEKHQDPFAGSIAAPKAADDRGGWKLVNPPADSEWKEVTTPAKAADDMGGWEVVPVSQAPQATISAFKPTIWNRVWNVLTEGIPQFSTRTVYNPKFGQQQFLAPEEAMTPLEQQAHPIVTGTLEFAGGLTSPGNIAIMAATSGLGTLAGPELKAASAVIPRLISAGCSTQQIIGAAKESKEVWNAIKRGDESEAKRLTTHVVLDLAAAALATQHAAGVEATPSTAVGRVADRAVDASTKFLKEKVVPNARLLKQYETQHGYAKLQSEVRRSELENAKNQVQAAADKLAEAQEKGIPQDIIQARNTLSQAAANARKAHQAFTDVDAVRVQAELDVNRTTRRLNDSLNKANVKNNSKIAGAHEDFKHIASRAADADISTARGYLERYHKNVAPIDSVQDVYDGLGHAKKVGIEDKIAPFIEKYGKDVITTIPAMDVHDKLMESPQADFADRGMKYLEQTYPQLLSPESLTVSEAQKVLTDLNSQNRGILESKPTIKIGTLLQTDPEFAARYHAAASLREGEYGLFNEREVEGIDQLRRDERAIINVENDVRRSLPKAGNKVRGSGKSGSFRRAAAWAIRRGAEVEGARMGGPIGAATGGWLGEKFGKAISPGDLTRDAVIQRCGKG